MSVSWTWVQTVFPQEQNKCYRKCLIVSKIVSKNRGSFLPRTLPLDHCIALQTYQLIGPSNIFFANSMLRESQWTYTKNLMLLIFQVLTLKPLLFMLSICFCILRVKYYTSWHFCFNFFYLFLLIHKAYFLCWRANCLNVIVLKILFYLINDMMMLLCFWYFGQIL